jgi:4-hydroxybenzoate polyprenyltransferase
MTTDLDLDGQGDSAAAAAVGAGPVWRALLVAIRPHHALKNLLVLVPLALSAGTAAPADVVRFVVAFLLFSLLTGGSYILNDVLDVEADRRDPRKRHRPIARGDVPVRTALGAALFLIAGPLAAGWLFEPAFASVLAGYLALTLAYSVRLKRIAFLDALVVAVLFALRIVAGTVLTDGPPIGALAAFGVLFFLGLALVKRVVEHSGAPGSRYAAIDRRLMVGCGVAAGVASAVPLALFVGALVASRPAPPLAPLLWLVPAVLAVWVAHVWRLASGGRIGGDPLVFALRDPASLALGALALGLVLASRLVEL